MPKSRVKASSPWRIEYLISAALFLIALALYVQVRSFDFVNYDDPDSVTNNPHVRAGVTPQGLVWALESSEAANWFPVTRISHMVDVGMFGLESGGHHLTSVFIHALATVLLFAFLNLATGARWPSAFVALLFAVHPLHVESVAWISERKDVLCALFWFLSLWLWVRYSMAPSPPRYLLALASFCLGLMSKPMIVTLPLLLLLLDWWPLRRGLRLREKAPFLAASAVSAAATIMVQKGSGAVEGLSAVPLGLRIENAAVSYLTYLRQTFWPAKLAVFYPYPVDLPVWQPIVAALVIAGISAAAWFCLRRLPYLAAGWLWFVVTLLPVIGLVQVGSQAHADRYMYVPMVGLAIMLAWGAQDAVRRWPAARTAVLGLAVLACACCVPLTWAQSEYWSNSESLYLHALSVTTNNALAEHNLGSYLLESQSQLPAAIEHLQTAQRINPDSASIHSDLGTALAKSGRFSEAIAEYQAAARLNPNSAIIHNNLANALQQSGRLPEAIAEYQAALRLDPDYADARKNLAIAQQTPPPDSAEAHYSEGVDLSHAGRLEEAVAQFREALRLRPDYAEAENNLGVTLTQIPRRAHEAMVHFQTAVRLNPNYADARYNLGVALSQIPGRTAEALAQLEAAYRLNPDPELRQTIDKLRGAH